LRRLRLFAANIHPASLMLWLYRILFIPALVLLAPGYLRRMRRRGGYRENFAHRFGAHDPLPAKQAGRPRVWLQAVSVGEILAIGPILEALHRDGVEIYLTTTTSTGYRLAHERYRGVTVGVGYFPIDWWPFVQRAWRRIAPDLIILTEGERWPEHLRQASKRHVPVVSINARLSDRSYARLKRFSAAARLMLGGVTRLLPASAEDAQRFTELGFPRERLVITGNIKLDVQIPKLTDAERSRLRRELGMPAGLILLGSSTWPGEEAALVEALQRARGLGVQCSLLLVPRHAERRSDIQHVLAATALRFHFRSLGPAQGEVDVAVGDTTGELRKLTQIADVVFVGKSLLPHTEGQTPVEAASLEKAILFGPGMSNFRALARDLLSRGAAREVADSTALITACEELLCDPLRRTSLAGAAAQWRRDNVGAVERTLNVLREDLAKVMR
jgi:3-deoxy-D-manno-octulosonic-acid transferase